MQTTTSADGTSIAYEQHGEGPPLVLVHGSSGTRHSWEAVVPHLAEEFQVIVPQARARRERRRRGVCPLPRGCRPPCSGRRYRG
ncbi:alpha/beta fold hydrolase [Halovenus salina]|uniref:alpha/beta fold hydrolase n=1 Tax=Halovenus salina TaxID=1510225 RepID=UPI002260C381|nr:hypothetical protein [Halovenus salina]